MAQIGETVSFHVPGEPVAFARAGSNGVRRYTPTKQKQYMETIAWKAREAYCRNALMLGPIRMSVRATYESGYAFCEVQRC